MKLHVWPACVDCKYLKLKKRSEWYQSNPWGPKVESVRHDYLECIHAPVCSRIIEQDIVKGGQE